MKRTFFFLLSFVMCLTASAQTQSVRDYKLNLYPFGNSPDLEQLTQHFDQNGSHYIFGGGMRYGSESDPALVRIHPDGSIANIHKRYSMPSSKEYNVHVTSLNTGTIKDRAGYLLSGTTGNNDGKYTFFIKTNLDGNPVWSRKLHLADQYQNTLRHIQIVEVRQVANQKIIVVGRLPFGNSGFDGNVNLAVLQLDASNGNLDWYRVYDSPDLGNDMRAFGFIEEEPGRYLIFGYSRYSTRAFILSLNSGLFGPLSSNLKIISHPGPKTSIKAMGIQGGDLIVAGTVSPNTFNTLHGTFVFRINPGLTSTSALDGTPGNSNVYLTSNYQSLTDITVLNDSRIMLTGNRNPVIDKKPFACLLNPNGSILNLRYGMEDAYESTSINCFSESNKFVALDNLRNKSLRVTTFDILGNTCAAIPGGTSVIQIPVKINNSELTIWTPSREYIGFTPPAIDISVPVDEICEGCLNTTPLAPITTTSGQTTFCTGGGLTLITPFSTIPFTSCQWFWNGNPIGSGNTINITNGGNYSVICTDADGCVKEQFISITEYTGCNNVDNILNPNIFYCSIGDNIPSTIGWHTDPLAACNGPHSFSWTYNGQPVAGYQNTPFVGPGVYNVVVTTPCTSISFSLTATDQLQAYINHSYATTTLTVQASNFVTFGRLNSFPAMNLYEWTVTNLTTGAPPFTGSGTTITIPYLNCGEVLAVNLKVTDVANCKTYQNLITWTDNCKRPSLGETVNESSNEILLVPNPTRGSFSVELDSFYEQTQIEVWNTMGERIFAESDLHSAHQEFDLSGYAKGLYFVRILKGGNTFVKKLVLQ